MDVPQLNLLLLTLTSLTSWHCWWLWGLLPSFLSTTCLLSILAAEPHGGFTRRLQSHFHLCALLLFLLLLKEGFLDLLVHLLGHLPVFVLRGYSLRLARRYAFRRV